MIRLKDLISEADKRFEIPQNKWTPILRSELPRFKRIIFDLIKKKQNFIKNPLCVFDETE